jgi:hypothetical protein
MEALADRTKALADRLRANTLGAPELYALYVRFRANRARRGAHRRRIAQPECGGYVRKVSGRARIRRAKGGTGCSLRSTFPSGT